MLRGVPLPAGAQLRIPISARQVQWRPTWKCVYDPGGVFTGRLFRAMDLLDGGGFAPGTVFEHIRNGERRVIGDEHAPA